ncbi:MAG: efflux RND transporter periplasmic adaptor subunit [Myxococcota bacterium]
MVASGVIWAASVGCGRPKAAEPKADAAKVVVEVEPVRSGRLKQTWTFAGEIQAAARSELAAGADGEVVRVSVELGDRIRTGQNLVTVDERLARARLATAQAEARRARAQLELAQTELTRLEQLKPGIVPAVDLDRARSTLRERSAQVEAADAFVGEAEATLALHRVNAPFDGVVVERRVDPGAWVRSGDPVLQVVSTESVDVILDAHQVLLRHIAPGVRARAPDLNDVVLEVAGVVPALDPVRRTARVRLVPADEDSRRQLLPGAAVSVAFEVALGSDADGGVLVPRDALLVSPSETRVATVEDGIADVFPVEVLARSAESALVRADRLEAGAMVVVRGNERLRPGQSVQVQGR